MGRGRLRLYLGMAPGVGKTSRMLEDGHRWKARGIDVVVGFAETHGREGVVRMIDGLEVVPRRRIEHRGLAVEDMDTDAVLEREPSVALVDDLGHSNLPGSPRATRWEDVGVLREAGIHVVSTMNVHHLESVADAAVTIVGAPVNDRLPDDVLLDADEVVLVDMSPHALHERMKHGDIFPADRIRVALEDQFTEPNLTALREIALRLVARRVEGQLELVAGSQLPLVTERVMVLVDGSRASMRAVRRAASLAAALGAAFVAVVLETPGGDRQPYDRARDVQETIDDAVGLGADIVRIEAKDVVNGLAEIARSRRATHVVIPYRDLGALRRLTERPLADRLIERLPELEVHVVAEKPSGTAGARRAVAP